jgi:hypothetical protein
MTRRGGPFKTMETTSVDAESFQLRLESLPRHAEYCGGALRTRHSTRCVVQGTLDHRLFACREVSGQRCAWPRRQLRWQANQGRRHCRATDRARPPPPVTRSSCGGYDVGGRPRIRQMLNLQPRSCGRNSARAGKRSRCARAMNESGLDKRDDRSYYEPLEAVTLACRRRRSVGNCSW